MTTALVENGVRRWGLFDARPTYVNPLEEFLGASRRSRRLRLKEWLGWTLVHPELSSSMIIQDAHYLASSELYVRDAATGRLTQHARNFRGGRPQLPLDLTMSNPKLSAKGYSISYFFGPHTGSHSIDVEVDGTDKEAPVSIHLALNGNRGSAPLSVSQPLLPRGAMYTHKVVLPAAGHVTVGDRTYEFRPDRDLAILDEHKSFLPYRTDWLWGTFAQQQSGGIVGANFCQRPAQPATQGEDCLWVPDAHGAPSLVPLSDVAFTPESATDPLSPWHVRSGDGVLDVTFTPDGRKDVKHQLVVFAIDYWQLYGTYSGVIGTHRVDGVRGVLEKMDARL